MDSICSPAEVRRCRFIETAPPEVAGGSPLPGFAPGGAMPRPNPDNREFEWERGRDVEEASFGRAAAPFRVVPLGAPDARFLEHGQQGNKRQNIENHTFS